MTSLAGPEDNKVGCHLISAKMSFSKILRNRRAVAVIFILLLLPCLLAVRRFMAGQADAPVPAGDYVPYLKSLGYVDSLGADYPLNSSGVTICREGLTEDGANLYSPWRSKEAYLVGMRGEYLHNWSYESEVEWEHVALGPDGSLLVVPFPFSDRLLMLDKNSRLIWSRKGPYHHDAYISPDGGIFALRKRMMADVSLVGRGRPVEDKSLLGKAINISDDVIEVLSPQGRLIRSVSLYDALWGEVPERLMHWYLNQSNPVDVFHTNSVAVLQRDLGVGEKGDILGCSAHMGIIFLIDNDTGGLKWSWGSGALDFPHNPTVLANGNILVLDNGPSRNGSRVIEVDPSDGRIVWEYGGGPGEPFFTDARGGAQPLQGGNVLVTETNTGRVFEVTRGGEIAWEYWNPHFNKDGGRYPIYRMTRYPMATVRDMGLLPS
jgi:hypothetical protein